MPQDPDPFDWHPELRRLDAELTEEFRAEAREYERLAALDHLRNRRLPDVALELLHRGDVTAVELARRTFTGTVVYAVADLLCLRTRTAQVDVWLEAPLTLHVLERVPDGGRSRTPGPSSFKGRLCEHEASGDEVTIGRRHHASELTGRIRAVALDHLVVEAGSGPGCYVPLTIVDYIAVVRGSR
ncbi:MAG: hypothetical protein ACRDZO_00505 [Egibacteraceae bacterium]